uniref:Uncharacterized protein n=1 Tax=Roseihalotalea indica TaxID=2867963 RepID=A0AA49JG87_9BACT|nr:hypothetical protein K4G66_27185 [Tunicatimonas sp. TK19036]
MMNVVKTVCLVALALTSINAYSQFKMPTQADASEFQRRKIAVLLKNPNQETLKDLKNDPTGQKLYHEWIGRSNDILKRSFEKFWTLNKEVSFVTADQFNSIREGKDATNFALFQIEYGTKNMRTPSGTRKRPGYLLQVFLADQKNPVFEIMTPSDQLAENDYKFVIHTMTQYLEAAAQGKKSDDLWDVDRNLATLEKKPLLIAEEQVAITAEKAQSEYAHSVKFTTMDKLEDQISEGQDILFCTVIFHMQKSIWMNATVDASNMEIVSLVPAESLDISLGVFTSESTGTLVPIYRSDLKLDKKYFKYTTNKLAMKVNH